MTWKGKVWQMTLAYVGHIVWTNEDMLAKYNLKPPTTYAEWKTMCDTLKSNKETPIFYAAKPQTALTRFASHDRDDRRSARSTRTSGPTCSSRARPTSPRPSGSSRSSGPRSSSTKYFDPAFSGIDYPTGAGLFATGKYAMWPEGSFSGGDIMAAKPTFQKLGAFNAPFVRRRRRQRRPAGLRRHRLGRPQVQQERRTWSWTGSTSSARRRTSRASCRCSSTTRPRTSS